MAILLATGTATAERTMIVLLDATGSMQMIRRDNNKTRFAQAQEDAIDRVLTVSNQPGPGGRDELQVAVYRFAGASPGLVPLTTGFVSAFDAALAIQSASPPAGGTPLADAMCAVIDLASRSGNDSTTKRFLEVFSDGAENSSTGDCSGPFSVTSAAPFDERSWQHRVYLRAANALPKIEINATLYHDVTGALAAAAARRDPEPAARAQHGRAPGAGSLAAATDADLFSALAVATGGTFTDVVDTAPVPVVGDYDVDFDVDRDDAILLARQFGAPASHAFDLDDDGKIGFADYALLLTRFGKGSGTPAHDPYTPGQTVTCGSGQSITIDGVVIEGGGITIQSSGSCRVTIRDSLIVSGAAAISVRGSTTLVINNTIVVGEAEWLDASGATALSAAGSVFHGAQHVGGAFVYSDRGGNTFEH